MVAFPLTASIQPSGSNCSKILKIAGLKDWEIGKTKVIYFLAFTFPTAWDWANFVTFR